MLDGWLYISIQALHNGTMYINLSRATINLSMPSFHRVRSETQVGRAPVPDPTGMSPPSSSTRRHARTWGSAHSKQPTRVRQDERYTAIQRGLWCSWHQTTTKAETGGPSTCCLVCLSHMQPGLISFHAAKQTCCEYQRRVSMNIHNFEGRGPPLSCHFTATFPSQYTTQNR